MSARSPKKPLIKRPDRWARPGEGGAVVDERVLSVLAGRSLEQIAEDRDRIWTGCGGG